jgi:hypothetical protein
MQCRRRGFGTVLTNRNGIGRPFREGKQAHLCESLDQ